MPAKNLFTRLPRMSGRDSGDEGQRRRIDHQYLIHCRVPSDAGDRGLRRVKGRSAAIDEIGRGLLWAQGIQYPLQLDPSGYGAHPARRGGA